MDDGGREQLGEAAEGGDRGGEGGADQVDELGRHIFGKCEEG
jgi:hypothetical protein